MLSTGGMLEHAQAAAEAAAAAGEPAREAVVATEVGMLYPLQMAAPRCASSPPTRRPPAAT